MSDEPAIDAWMEIVQGAGKLSKAVKEMQRDRLVKALEELRDRNLSEEPAGTARDGMEYGYNEAIALVRNWVVP